MRIDAHHHLWKIARGDYGWLTPQTGIIHRDYHPSDFAPVRSRHGIDASILVQAAPTIAETHYLLSLAAGDPTIAGVVGWADFEAPDAPETIAALARDPLLVGLRPMVHDIPDPDWLRREYLTPAFDALVAHGLVFDALVRPEHLPALDARATRHPALTIVVDHCAKPPIAAGPADPRHARWLDAMTALARHSHVVCKLSGLATEAGANWTADDLRPYARHALAAFKPERVLWGSDWPVVDLAGGYDRWVAATEHILADLPPDARRAILGGNAARTYLSRRDRTPC